MVERGERCLDAARTITDPANGTFEDPSPKGSRHLRQQRPIDHQAAVVIGSADVFVEAIGEVGQRIGIVSQPIRRVGDRAGCALAPSPLDSGDEICTDHGAIEAPVVVRGIVEELEGALLAVRTRFGASHPDQGPDPVPRRGGDPREALGGRTVDEARDRRLDAIVEGVAGSDLRGPHVPGDRLEEPIAEVPSTRMEVGARKIVGTRDMDVETGFGHDLGHPGGYRLGSIRERVIDVTDDHVVIVCGREPCHDIEETHRVGAPGDPEHDGVTRIEHPMMGDRIACSFDHYEAGAPEGVGYATRVSHRSGTRSSSIVGRWPGSAHI